MKKFSFTDETKVWCGITLHRIKAEIAFGIVVKGELGGFIAKEENLDHDGDAWVSGDARVYGDARVSDNARVYGDAWVSGNARVSGDARVSDNARVSGNARVYGDAWVSGNARVSGDARVSDNASIMWISKIGSRNGTTTFFRSKLGIEVSCGCFFGTIDQFAEKVGQTHGDNEHGKAYRLAIEIARLHINQSNEILEPTESEELK